MRTAKATIINACAERETITLSELVQATNLSEESIKKRITFWVSRGFLKEIISFK